MSNAAHRALRRLGAPEPMTVTKALNAAFDRSVTHRGPPGSIIMGLSERVRDALQDLRSDDLADLRDDFVRPWLPPKKV